MLAKRIAINTTKAVREDVISKTTNNSKILMILNVLSFSNNIFELSKS